MKLKNLNADFIGISGSVLCILHCLLLPLFAFWQASGEHNTDNHFWDYFFVAISLYAVYNSLRHAARVYIKVMLVGGWAIFMLATLIEQHLLMQIGSFLLILAHSLNLYFCRKEACVY